MVRKDDCAREVVHTFCTLMLWLVLLKMRLAFIAFANRFAYSSISNNSCDENGLRT